MMHFSVCKHMYKRRLWFATSFQHPMLLIFFERSPVILLAIPQIDGVWRFFEGRDDETGIIRQHGRISASEEQGSMESEVIINLAG